LVEGLSFFFSLSLSFLVWKVLGGNGLWFRGSYLLAADLRWFFFGGLVQRAEVDSTCAAARRDGDL
jgi:hypothetical protein